MVYGVIGSSFSSTTTASINIVLRCSRPYVQDGGMDITGHRKHAHGYYPYSTHSRYASYVSSEYPKSTSTAPCAVWRGTGIHFARTYFWRMEYCIPIAFPQHGHSCTGLSQSGSGSGSSGSLAEWLAAVQDGWRFQPAPVTAVLGSLVHVSV